jgi:probable FeS assembly SUF system protein SufT
MAYEQIETLRDCEGVQIPQGVAVNIPAGTTAVITQSLGGSYTLQIPSMGGLFRVAGRDADALGRQVEAPAAAAPAADGPVSEDAIWTQLRNVYDPEIPVNIYELGLVYDVLVDADRKVGVRMTLTAPACPAAQTLPGEVRDRARGVEGVSGAQVEITFDPPWSMERMTDAARLQLGLL